MNEYISCDRVDFASGDCIDGQYIVDKVLGEGTFGRVYKVHSGKTVYALKLLKLWKLGVKERPELLKRFDREYETSRIDSSYLIHTYEKGVVKGNPYLVMEYCSKGDLFAVFGSERLDSTSVATDILYGLRDLHKNGKVHRDLKPENVLVKDDGHAALTDFGIAGDQNIRLTLPGARFGTLPYMPPEQVNPPRNRVATVLPTTDIFSFGVMMYLLLTQRFPFGKTETDKDIASYLSKAKAGKWDKTLLQDKAPHWIEVIEGCLQSDYTVRLQSVDDVLQLLPHQERILPYRQPAHFSFPLPQLTPVNGYLLRVMEGEEHGKVYKLNSFLQNGPSVITVGRKDSDVYNKIEILENGSSYISRCHCTIESTHRGQWLIRDGQARVDCGIAKLSPMVYPCDSACHQRSHCSKNKMPNWIRSMNGTFVNSKEVDAIGLFLTPGDIISMGEVKLRVEVY